VANSSTLNPYVLVKNYVQIPRKLCPFLHKTMSISCIDPCFLKKVLPSFIFINKNNISFNLQRTFSESNKGHPFHIGFDLFPLPFLRNVEFITDYFDNKIDIFMNDVSLILIIK